MAISKKTVMLAGDFETTVYECQTSTEVWSAAYARLFSEKIAVHHSIKEFLDDLFSYRCNIVAWFHNLRFDGTFIVNYLLQNGWEWTSEKKPQTKQFRTLISKQNRWYTIEIYTGNARIELRDSAKLMPMALKEVGEAFQTEHRKLEMEYVGKRYAGCNITMEEMNYIINDVLVLKEALEYMVNEGNTELTIGSCALKKFKSAFSKREYENLFPRLDTVDIDGETFRDCNADAYIRRSYKGGWCYLHRKGTHRKGRTYDVNSLYPSSMHSKSGNYYPVGKPHFWVGNIPETAKKGHKVYFVRFKCRFYLKKDHVPTVQLKGNHMYNPTEWLTTSDVKFRGKYFRDIYGKGGELIECKPVMTMTCVDFKLFQEHYNIEELEILDGCWFYARIGLFDEYIDFWMSRKMNAKTKAERTEAKFFLNNLYGKFATGTDSSFREPVLMLDGRIELLLHEENNKTPGYIAVGSMVTSYAREFTIRRAQLNYESFIYADTDSLHLTTDSPVGLDIHSSNLLCWKNESEWTTGVFIRQKTYAEFIRKEDGEKVEPHWEIKCAGMPEASKKLFLATHPITDFRYGLRVKGKLKPKRIPGGIILTEEYFTLHST